MSECECPGNNCLGPAESIPPHSTSLISPSPSPPLLVLQSFTTLRPVGAVCGFRCATWVYVFATLVRGRLAEGGVRGSRDMAGIAEETNMLPTHRGNPRKVAISSTFAPACRCCLRL
jgi:hypothetical protein